MTPIEYSNYASILTDLKQAVKQAQQKAVFAANEHMIKLYWLIGHTVLLCQGKNKVLAEYALKDIGKPIGVSAYQITESIPDKLKGCLPTIEEIENELSQGLE